MKQTRLRFCAKEFVQNFVKINSFVWLLPRTHKQTLSLLSLSKRILLASLTNLIVETCMYSNSPGLIPWTSTPGDTWDTGDSLAESWATSWCSGCESSGNTGPRLQQMTTPSYYLVRLRKYFRTPNIFINMKSWRYADTTFALCRAKNRWYDFVCLEI